MSFGFLYVLVNSGMPGLVKVGKTTRDPVNRVTELSSATGVPSPFILVYAAEVGDCHSAEAWAHAELESKGYRPNASREFFTAPVQEAIDTVIAARTSFSCATHALNSVGGEGHDDGEYSIDGDELSEAESLYELAYTYLKGSDSVLVDGEQALRLFEQSASMGHADAASMAAIMYQYGSAGIRANPRKALTLHQKAVSQGEWSSYSNIAAIFSDAGQSSAAQNHWVLFFEAAREAVDAAHEPAQRAHEIGRAGFHGRYYISSLMNGDIEGCVALDHLRYFQEAMNASWAKYIAMEPVQDMVNLYGDLRTFLRKMLEAA